MIIYKITNKITNECYIGKTIQSLTIRKQKHKYDMKRKKSKLYQNIKQYGWANFNWKILFEVNNKLILKQLERTYIKLHNAQLNSNNI